MRLVVRCSRRSWITCKFQFQIGAIGSKCSLHGLSALCGFQFQIGAIGSLRRPWLRRRWNCFNSRLVRLVAYGDTVTITFEKFQFQIGAIGSFWKELIFHRNIGFNSRLVRLVVLRPLGCQVQKTKFQFQIGAIGSNSETNSKTFDLLFQFPIGAFGSIVSISVCKSYASFNSRLVRLVDKESSSIVTNFC